MPKKTNRYISPRERANRASRAAAAVPGRFGLAGRLVSGAARSLRRRAHPGRQVLIVGSLLLALLIGAAGLGVGLYLGKVERDWASVATVNGHSIDRENLRGRIAVLKLLAQERIDFVRAGVTGGNLTSDQASALEASIAATTGIDAARETLIDDELLRELASRDGVATPASPDPWIEATSYMSGDLAHRLRFLRFGLPATASTSPTTPPDGWPAAATATIEATTARVRTELGASTPVATIVSRLHDAGWQVFGEEVSVSAAGISADASLHLDPAIAAATLRGTPGDIVGPATDPYGRVSIARLLDVPSATSLSQRLSSHADSAKVDTAALQSWANGRALRRSVTASLIGKWRNTPVIQAHFRELVTGAVPTGGSAGPWVELSGLAVDRLKGVSPTSIAGAPAGLDLKAAGLARYLNSIGPADRTSLFRALVTAANNAPDPSGTGLSGELGFHTKLDLAPEIGSAAFDAAVHTGDVIGPIATAVGSRLYLIESRYAGALDERASSTLRQIRIDPSPDFAAYARQYSPADAVLAADAGWRTEPEFASTDPVRAALFDTPIGITSDPFALDDKLAVAVVTERRTAVPDDAATDRLTLWGYDAWYASEFAKATITRADNPLPELLPSSSPSPTASEAQPLPSAPPLDTPNLPRIPGQPTTAPGSTDATVPGMP